MKLKPGHVDEYKRRHDALWPELKELFAQNGITDYTIHFDPETNLLFGIHSSDGRQGAQDLGTNPVVQKWWAFMADIMETNNDNSPVTIPLQEVFYLK